MWVEVNARVNYPIKRVLVQMEQRDEINMNFDHEKFCVLWFTMHTPMLVLRHLSMLEMITGYQVGIYIQL